MPSTSPHNARDTSSLRATSGTLTPSSGTATIVPTPTSPQSHGAYPFPGSGVPNSPKSQLTAVLDGARPSSRSGSTPSPTQDGLARPVTTVSGSGLRTHSPASSYSGLSSLTAPSSRASSRRPSIATLQSFLEGVTHTTRVRSPSLRGHSRRGSTESGAPLFSPAASDRLSRRPSYTNLFADEEDFVIDDLDDDQPAVFVEGERLFLGSRHQGHLVTAAAMGNEEGLKLEVIRKVGSGSYAVVYLARQILYDPLDDESYDPDDDLDGSPRQIVYGKELALKCLCKHNLDEELLQVQRFEVTLHSSLPPHPNIVALTAALETPAWLFLVMEYCPGQDLFYWLEQARDHAEVSQHQMHPAASFESATPSENLYASTPRASAMLPPPLPQSDSTPPSPSILSATANSSLLSRRRLRLISRMFEQMCEAVSACHAVGVSHRDIKPENFICSTDDGERVSRGDRKVVVKLTDWGLGSNEDECGDFDCGSKPYMAYECRNNLGPAYRPRPADIWSLGIVLLNLLFHRCPWSDPTLEDPDFVAFRADRVGYLASRFNGIGSEVSEFLAKRVFCDNPDQRVSASEFGQWASKLVRYMGGSTAAVSDTAPLLEPTTARPSLLPSHRPSSTLSSIRPSPRVSIAAAQSQNTPKPSSDLPEDLKEVLSNHAVPLTQSALANLEASTDTSEVFGKTPAARPHASAPPVITKQSSTPPEPADEQVPVERDTPSEHIADVTVTDDVPASPDADAAALVARHRRRKRGSRKPRPPDVVTSSKPSDDLSDLAEATEGIARELSRVRSESADGPSTSSKRPASGLMSRIKGSIMNGNPDLEAFRQRALERDMTLGYAPSGHRGAGTASAPAKLGHGERSTDSNASWQSSSSWSDGSERAHWASTSDRRTRLAHHHSNGTSSSSPSPGRRSGTTSFSGTPLTSVSTYSEEESATTPRKNGPPLQSIAEVHPSPTPSSHSTLHAVEPKGSRFGRMWRALN